MTDPDGNPATADHPGVVNNSWSASSANDTWFRPMIRRWLELGIVPVFAAGNTGPGAGQHRQPGRLPRGDRGRRDRHRRRRAGLLEPRADRLAERRRPRARRGHAARQARPGRRRASASSRASASGYLAYSGTSMAAPHVAGVAALVRQADPGLAAAAVADILRGQRLRHRRRRAPTRPPARAGWTPCAPSRPPSGPAPDTRFTSTPGAVTNAALAGYAIALSGGGVMVRTRVDGGQWSAPTTALDPVAAPRRGAPRGRGPGDRRRRRRRPDARPPRRDDRPHPSAGRDPLVALRHAGDLPLVGERRAQRPAQGLDPLELRRGRDGPRRRASSAASPSRGGAGWC